MASKCLRDLAVEIQELLHTRHAKAVEGITPELHLLPPFIPKPKWTELGDAIKAAERPEGHEIPGNRWISLRLDGSGFSRHMRLLRNAGLLDKGFSPLMADVMQECVQSLMKHVNGRIGYTQSDEMTVLLAPMPMIRGEQQCHQRNGRVVKIATLAAAHVTGLFNHRMAEAARAKGLPFDVQHLASFDCRVGSYETVEEAMSLVWWRAYDSGVNGVADAVYQRRGVLEGAKEMMLKGTDERLMWLLKHDQLPLHPHQAYGSFFTRVLREVEAVNPKTGEATKCIRRVVEHVPGQVLIFSRNITDVMPDVSNNAPEPEEEGDNDHDNENED